MPKKIRQELEDLETVDEARELPEPGTYLKLLEEPQEKPQEAEAKTPRHACANAIRRVYTRVDGE